MSTLAETLRQLASQFERLMSNGSGGSSLVSTVLGSGLGGGGTNSTSALPGAFGQLANGVLGGPLGMVASAFTSLFRDEPEPVVLPVYERPEALSLDFDIRAAEAFSRGGTLSVSNSESFSSSETERISTPSAATVLIQVNAMDASSFSDRRNEIASAVREALTRNHSLRDEIWEE